MKFIDSIFTTWSLEEGLSGTVSTVDALRTDVGSVATCDICKRRAHNTGDCPTPFKTRAEYLQKHPTGKDHGIYLKKKGEREQKKSSKSKKKEEEARIAVAESNTSTGDNARILLANCTPEELSSIKSKLMLCALQIGSRPVDHHCGEPSVFNNFHRTIGIDTWTETPVGELFRASSEELVGHTPLEVESGGDMKSTSGPTVRRVITIGKMQFSISGCAIGDGQDHGVGNANTLISLYTLQELGIEMLCI